MKIAAYIRPRAMIEPTGVGKHMINMVRELSRLDGVDLCCFTGRPDIERYGIPPEAGLRGIPLYLMPFPCRIIEWMWTFGGFPYVDRWLPPVDWVYCPLEVCVPVRKARLAVTLHHLEWFDKDLPWYGKNSMRKTRFRLKPVYRKIVIQADVVCAVSGYVKSKFVEFFGADPSKIEIAGNGVEDVFYRAASAGSSVAESSDSERPFVLVIGPVQERKGSGYMFAVADRLKVLDPGLRIKVACGQAVSPEFKGEIGKHTNVDLLPYISLEELADLMRHARVLLFLSRYESFGIPAAEAMASGVPVIVSSFAGLPETVGDAGVVADVNDIDGIAGRVMRFLNDQEFYEQYRLRGIKRAEQFHWKDCAQRVLQTMQRR